jgi:hypothetical protein
MIPPEVISGAQDSTLCSISTFNISSTISEPEELQIYHDSAIESNLIELNSNKNMVD